MQAKTFYIYFILLKIFAKGEIFQFWVLTGIIKIRALAVEEIEL